MALYASYARLSLADDYPQGVPVERLRRAWRALANNWGDPDALRYFAPSQADDPELRERWGRLLRSGASPGVIARGSPSPARPLGASPTR